MPIIRDGKIIEDHWLTIRDEDEIPDAGDIILSPEHALDYVAMGRRHKGRLGARIKSDANPETLGPLLDKIDLIELEFLSFTDGRAYSQATQLRQHLGFKGEIRARGNILVDQLQFMRRCGFDSFEITDKRHFKVWQKTYADLNHAYQRRAQPNDLTGIRKARAG